MSSLGGVTTRPAAQRPAAREKLVMRNNKNIAIHKKLEWNKARSARPEPLISTIPRLIFKLQYDELGMYYLNFLTNGRISGIGVPSLHHGVRAVSGVGSAGWCRRESRRIL